MGLFVLRDVKEGDVVAHYSGEAISAAQAMENSSEYILRIHSSLFLDAHAEDNRAGRWINDGAHSGRIVNARFASAYNTNPDTTPGRRWVKVFATRDLSAGDEVFVDYGEGY
jgi:SET domain-containing protein